MALKSIELCLVTQKTLGTYQILGINSDNVQQPKKQ